MELEHSFTVPVSEDRAWEVLLDVERVAPCMPGATLQSIDGDVIHGSIKVKVGPISMTYQGTARFSERDPAAHVITLEATGKDTRGAGTASAKVRSTLDGKGAETHVVVHTSLNVTGKPAQFGRGVMTEVGGRLIGIFADNLAKMLAADPGAGSAGISAGPAGVNAGSAGTGAGNGGSAAQAGPAAATPATAPAADSSAQDEALPIDVLNLGTRAWTSLHEAGIQTIGDLIKRTPQQLLAIDNIGPASIADIRRKLADRGLALVESAAGANGTSAGATDSAASGQPGEAERPAAVLGNTGTPAEANGAEANGAEAASSAEQTSTVTPLRPAQGDKPPWQAQDDAIDLLSVAGLPVLKRALPAVAAAIGVLLVLVGLRRRRASRRS
jgi:carbon monoxide dehydrogenase subunit G